MNIKSAFKDLKNYFAKSNGYEVASITIIACVFLVILLARPTASQVPAFLRLMALATAMAAKFLSNSNLSDVPGTPVTQVGDKKLAIVLDVLAAIFVGLSFLPWTR